jgi:hypothetical protein
MLKPEVSVPVALATGGVVFGIYNLALPTLADSRAVEANNDDLRAAENTALWASVVVCGGVALLANDPTPFVVGGLMAVALSWMHRHARAVDPSTGGITQAVTGGIMRAPTELRATFDSAPA